MLNLKRHSQNGCPYEVTETVDVFDPPALNIETSDLTCFDSNDGSIDFTVSGGDGTYIITIDGVVDTFTADGSITALSPGTYTFDVTDGNGCSEEQTVSYL